MTAQTHAEKAILQDSLDWLLHFMQMQTELQTLLLSGQLDSLSPPIKAWLSTQLSWQPGE